MMQGHGTAEAVETIIGPTGHDLPVGKGLTLGIEKFRQPDKHYRLIWLSKRTGEWFAWLAEEDTTRFGKKRDAVTAGKALAKEVGATFDEKTR